MNDIEDEYGTMISDEIVRLESITTSTIVGISTLEITSQVTVNY